MTTSTLTAETAAGDLLAELRELLQRHDGASTLDEARELADDITTVLRRARGRITRLARKVAPTRTETAKAQPPAEPKPAPEQTVVKPAPAPAAAALVQAPAPRVDAQPHRTPERATPAPATENPPAPARVVAPRRVSTLRYAVTAVTLLTVGVARGAGHLVRSAGRRALTALTRRRTPAGPAMPIPRPEEAPPLSTWRRSPLDIAAGLQTQKARLYERYQDTVLQMELGARVVDSLNTINQEAS